MEDKDKTYTAGLKKSGALNISQSICGMYSTFLFAHWEITKFGAAERTYTISSLVGGQTLVRGSAFFFLERNSNIVNSTLPRSPQSKALEILQYACAISQ